jgi:hypothetical protein
VIETQTRTSYSGLEEQVNSQPAVNSTEIIQCHDQGGLGCSELNRDKSSFTDDLYLPSSQTAFLIEYWHLI